LKAIGIGGVYVDFMGAHPQTHDVLAGVEGAHQLAREAVIHLLGVGLPVTPLIILNRANVDEINDFLIVAHELGAQEVGLLRLYPIGRARRRWAELALSLDEQMHLIRSLRPPPGLHLMQSWHPKNGNCCWQMAAVDPYGTSIGCPYLREFVDYGNVREVKFLATWDHPLYRMLREGKVAETCVTCSAGEGTNGGCRSTAFAFHGRWDAPDPFDEPLNAGVNLRELPKSMLEPDKRAANSASA
jgi:radical SAM protein with 4Fe4S-binding SPASM domain